MFGEPADDTGYAMDSGKRVVSFYKKKLPTVVTRVAIGPFHSQMEYLRNSTNWLDKLARYQGWLSYSGRYRGLLVGTKEMQKLHTDLALDMDKESKTVPRDAARHARINCKRMDAKTREMLLEYLWQAGTDEGLISAVEEALDDLEMADGCLDREDFADTIGARMTNSQRCVGGRVWGWICGRI